MKIVALEPIGVNLVKEKEIQNQLTQYDCSFIHHRTKAENEDELIERAKDADFVILTNLKISRKFIESCKKLKLISIAFTGYDHVDIQACKDNNVMVCNAANYSNTAVKELSLALAIDLYRKIIPLHNVCIEGIDRKKYLGREIHSKKVGIIGTGNIGSEVAKLYKFLGADVIAYSRTEKEDLKELGIEYTSLDNLLKQSDIISLHLPLNNETKHIINKENIKNINETAVIINTARGALVDIDALSIALNNEEIAGAAFDVFDYEPPLKKEYSFINAKNIIATPHIGFATKEAIAFRAELVIDNIIQFINDSPVRVIV